MSKSVRIGNVTIVSAGAMPKFIESIRSRGVKLDADIRRAAISAVLHRIETNDNGFMAQLLDALPRGSRGAAVRVWFEKYGSVQFDTETSRFKNIKLSIDEMRASLAEGVASDFWAAKVSENGDWTLTAEVEKVVGYLHNHAKKAEKEGEAALADALKASATNIAKLAPIPKAA